MDKEQFQDEINALHTQIRILREEKEEIERGIQLYKDLSEFLKQYTKAMDEIENLTGGSK